MYVAYTPALDLSTSGKTHKEVQKRFNEIVDIFFEEIIERGTLDEVLAGLGWEKVRREWVPPTVISHTIQPMNISYA